MVLDGDDENGEGPSSLRDDLTSTILVLHRGMVGEKAFERERKSDVATQSSRRDVVVEGHFLPMVSLVASARIDRWRQSASSGRHVDLVGTFLGRK